MRRIAFLTLLLPSVAAAQVALVTDLAGAAGKLGILSEVHAQTTVQLDGAMTVLYYASGDEYSLRGPARIAFGATEPKVLQGPPAVRSNTPAKRAEIKPGGVAPATFVMRRPGRSSDPSADAAEAPLPTVSRELRAQIEAARPPTNAPVAERVAFAVWLEQVGLKGEARVYWQALAVERPDSRQLKELASK